MSIDAVMQKQISNLDYTQLLFLRLEINTRLEEKEAAARKHLTEHPEKLNFNGFHWKKGKNTRSLQDLGGLVEKLESAAIPKTELYDAKLKGVPAIQKIIESSFDAEDAKVLKEAHIKTETGKPSLVFGGAV